MHLGGVSISVREKHLLDVLQCSVIWVLAKVPHEPLNVLESSIVGNVLDTGCYREGQRCRQQAR